MPWSMNNKAVPGSIHQVFGAQYPPALSNSTAISRNSPKMDYRRGDHDPTSKGSNKHPPARSQDAFQKFQSNTNDAWVFPEGSASAGLTHDLYLAPDMVQDSAQKVLIRHKKQMEDELQYRKQAGKVSSSSNNDAPCSHHQQSIPTAPSGHSTQFQGTSAAVSATSGARVGSGARDMGRTTAAATSGGVSFSSSGPGRGAVPGGTGPTSSVSGGTRRITEPMTSRENSRIEKFSKLLESPSLNLEDLRKLSWSGIPQAVRPLVWKILSGYVPCSKDRRDAVLERKRAEYADLRVQYYESSRDNTDFRKKTHHQIHIDIPRMNPKIPIFHQLVVQQMFERILFIWAIRHPASGYVQGMNDLVTPFFIVFLREFVDGDVILEDIPVAELLSTKLQAEIEADCFWCFVKLMDDIQDNYTFAQPGIQRKVDALEKLMQRIDASSMRGKDESSVATSSSSASRTKDRLLSSKSHHHHPPSSSSAAAAAPSSGHHPFSITPGSAAGGVSLHAHLRKHSIQYLQFAFRWMNNLLMRELPLRCIIRLWDTYLAESDGFSELQLYVCSALLLHFSNHLLREHEFHTLMELLQRLPTDNWHNDEIGLLLAEAYKVKYIFADAPKHLDQNNSSSTN